MRYVIYDGLTLDDDNYRIYTGEADAVLSLGDRPSVDDGITHRHIDDEPLPDNADTVLEVTNYWLAKQHKASRSVLIRAPHMASAVITAAAHMTDLGAVGKWALARATPAGCEVPSWIHDRLT